jgi:hypothetical protein
MMASYTDRHNILSGGLKADHPGCEVRLVHDVGDSRGTKTVDHTA